MSSLYRIVKITKEVLFDNITSYDEAFQCYEMLSEQGNTGLEIEEIPSTPISGLGRDPDLH
jgi:hypothetical protein